MIKFISVFIKVIFLFSIIETFCGCKYNEDLSKHVFLPLARIKLNTDGRINQLNLIVEAFAKSKSLHLERGSYASSEHEVENIELDFDKDAQSFIRFTNHRDIFIFDIAIYSHQNEDVWKPLWTEFLSDLRAEFGARSIVIVSDDK